MFAVALCLLVVGCDQAQPLQGMTPAANATRTEAAPKTAAAASKATPVLGLNGMCEKGDAPPHAGNCWAGLVRGEYWFVSVDNPQAGAPQGSIEVYTSTLDQLTQGPRLYYSASGGLERIYIRQVNWPYLIIVPADTTRPVTSVFNLETRNWVEVPGSAATSPTPSP